MCNKEKLKQLFIDVFLLEPEEFHFGLKREDVETWDSFGIVAMATGIEEIFGLKLKPEEAIAIKGVSDIIKILESKGVSFNE